MAAGAFDPELRTLLDNRFGSGTPATWYIAALLALPGVDGTGYTEVANVGSYARIAVTNNSTNWPAATTVGTVTSKANGTAFAHPNPTADWGLVIGWGAFTVSTIGSGVCAYANLLDGSITVKNGNTPVQYDIGQLVIANARPT